jgi:hypothetical protein
VKPVQVVLVIAVVISAGAAGYFALQRSGHGSGHAHSVPGPAAAQNNLPLPPLANPGQAPSRPENATAKHPALAYRKEFVQATSYYDFVRHAIPAAKAGNPEAQFYVSEALGYCKQGYERYFHKPSPDLPIPSLEEQIGKFQGHLSQHIAPMRNIYNRCHDLMENDVAQWGTREDWLAKATDAGLPAAQARAAELLLVAEEFHEPPSIKIREQDPRALLRSALETEDPAALLAAGTLLRAIDEMSNPRLNDAHAREGRTENQLAWWLLACNRGYDCSENGPWFVAVCASDLRCQPGTNAVDYIHRVADDLHYADLEQRAEELNAKVDARAWGELGLGGG